MALNLISKDSFIGFLNIEFSQSDQVDDFTPYADQIEAGILSEAFGTAMYEDMVANPTDQKYIDLINDYRLGEMLERFFYFYYLRDRESYSTTLGEFESLAENADAAPAPKLTQKLTARYNEAKALYDEATTFVSENTDTYTLYSETKEKRSTNIFGIDTDGVNTTYPENAFLTGFCRNTLYNPYGYYPG